MNYSGTHGRFLVVCVILSLFFSCFITEAAVSLSSLFADNMVLQRNEPIRVFGRADSGEAVTVTLDSNSANTTAGSDGKWLVELPSMTAGGPYTLTINSVTLTNVLIGDVWFCSGQSNMQIIMNSDGDSASELPKANYPQMRILRLRTEFPRGDNTAIDTLIKWSAVTPNTVDGFSAIGYYFGKKVHEETGVPIGLIEASRGGTKVEAWTREDTFAGHPIGRAILDYYNDLPNGSPEKQEQDRPGALFPCFVEPLTPFSMKGVVWYQGEHNTGRFIIYNFGLRNMIENWREAFQQPDLPFIIIQLPKYGVAGKEDSEIAALRGIQAEVANDLDNVEYAAAINEGTGNNHPPNKRKLGTNTGLVALKKFYGQNIVWSGPRYKSATFTSNSAIIEFDNPGGTLSLANSGAFRISSGLSNGFVRATATLSWNKVTVTGVNNPVAVRHAWEDMPTVSLVNAEGLFATPFRTDKWWPYNSAPKAWADVATTPIEGDKDGDGCPNYVEFFANTDFRNASSSPIIWKVDSHQAGVTAYRYLMNDRLSPEISYELQVSPAGSNTWSALSYVNYPDTGENIDYQVNYGIHEIFVPGNVDIRLAISIPGYTWYSMGSESGVNQPPNVFISSPSGGASFSDSDTINVTVTASDSDGSVDHVEFYVDGAQNGSNDTVSPYTWTLSGLAEGTHSLTAVAQDNDGARSTSDAVTISVTSAGTGPTITDQPDSVTNVIGQTVTFSVTATGSDPLSYQWRFLGSDIDGATTNTLTLTNVQLSDAGEYVVFVNNDFGSELSAAAVLTVLDGDIPRITTTSLPNGSEGSAYSATLEAAGSDTPLSWSLVGEPEWLSVAAGTGVLSGVPNRSGAFYFHAVVTDNEGDSDTETFSITVPAGQSVLVDGTFENAFNGNSGTSYQTDAGNGWYVPGGHMWNQDTVNKWAWADSAGAPSLVQVIGDNGVSTGLATLSFDVKNTEVDSIANDLQVAVYGANGAFNMSLWNMDTPTGTTLLLHKTGLAGTTYDWKTMTFSDEVNLGDSGYTYLIVRFWVGSVNDTAGDFLAIDNCSLLAGSAPDTSYIDWALSHGLSGVKVDDADGDGLSDFVEYAFNGNPTNKIKNNLVEYQVGANWQQIVYPVRKDGSVVYNVEISTNLLSGGWSTNGVTVLSTGSLNADFDVVTNRINSVGHQGYLRVRISE